MFDIWCGFYLGVGIWFRGYIVGRSRREGGREYEYRLGGEVGR